MKHVAFLRGINVSGQKIIRMADLGEMFEAMDFKNVKTYIQSGNVIFETARKNPLPLAKKIEKSLHAALGYEVTVFVRTLDALQKMVTSNPFKNLKDDAKRYVTFLSMRPDDTRALFPAADGVKILHVENADIFSLSLPLPNGRSGFPNTFIEKKLKLPATTRNWTTITKIATQF